VGKYKWLLYKGYGVYTVVLPIHPTYVTLANKVY